MLRLRPCTARSPKLSRRQLSVASLGSVAALAAAAAGGLHFAGRPTHITYAVERVMPAAREVVWSHHKDPLRYYAVARAQYKYAPRSFFCEALQA